MPAKFKLKKGFSVGAIEAELDRELQEVFLDRGDLDILKDAANPRCVIVGRTGAGKTALLLTLEARKERVLRVNPVNLSLQYLSNSTIIAKLGELGVHLEIFFQLLWRHVLVMELLREHFDLRDEAKQASFLNRISAMFTSKAHKQALEYYREWNPTLWEDADVRVIEITRTLDNKLEASLGNDYGKLMAGAAEGLEERRELVNRAQGVVQQLSLERIQAGMDLVRTQVLADRQKPYYVVIDDLDKRWVDAPLAHELIEALLDVVGEFARMPNVKIVVALRDNIVEILHAKPATQRQQREKHEGLFLRLQWRDRELIQLVDRRLERLIKHHYGGSLTLAQLMPDPHKKAKRDASEYLIERTMNRPRDIIDFVNRCLEIAVDRGTNNVSWSIILEAEASYSVGRLRSLEDEWTDTFPDIGIAMAAFEGISDGFTLADLGDSRLEELLKVGEGSTDPSSLARLVYQAFLSTDDWGIVWRALLDTLYKTGFIGVKRTPNEPVTFAYEKPDLLRQSPPEEASYFIHPSVYLALNIRNGRRALKRDESQA